MNSNKISKGGTTELTTLLTYLLGSMVFLGYYRLAIAVAVLVTLLLAFKVSIHGFIGKVTQQDLHALLKFTVITFLVLPFLPDQAYGPYDNLNPFSIWTIVVLLTALNFTGYLLAKFISARKGIIVTGILGGLVSSTAVSWFFARQSKQYPLNSVNYAAAILLASSIMFPRILLWLYIYNQDLLVESWFYVLIIGLIGIAVALLLTQYNKAGNISENIPGKNPLNLSEALRFGAIYVGILLLVGFAEENFGDEGIYVVSGISGLTDVDAITISLANLSMEEFKLSTASLGIVIAAIANTLVKYGLCLLFGSNELRKYSSYGFLSILLAGLVVLVTLIL